MTQDDKIEQELKRLNQKETRFLNSDIVDGKLKLKIKEKIPDDLEDVLNKAFVKAFEIVFNKGTAIIEKSYDKEKINLEYEVNKFMLDYKKSDSNIKKIDDNSKKTNLVNNLLTTSVGTGMGILGLGIPDIPIFVATLLRGVYQTALNYGFEYKSREEKIYILRLIRTALTKTSDQKKIFNAELDSENYDGATVDKEINLTAETLSNTLLIEKFIQGIPVIGVVGGVINNSIYKKVSSFSMIKYKKRYLSKELNN